MQKISDIDFKILNSLLVRMQGAVILMNDESRYATGKKIWKESIKDFNKQIKENGLQSQPAARQK